MPDFNSSTPNSQQKSALLEKSLKPLVYADQTVYFTSAEKMDAIEDSSVTLVITSPPYWNVRDYGGEQIGFRQSYSDYILALNRVWTQCIQKLVPNGKLAINFQPLPISSEDSGFNRRIIKDIMWDVQAFMHQHDFYLSGMHYWDKASYVNNVAWGSYPKPTNIHSNTSFEQIYVFVKPGKTRSIAPSIMERNVLTKEEWRHWAVRCIWDDISPVIKINSKGENLFGHSAPFPEDIPYRIIRMHTVEGETVLDPFLGSGTTLKICRLTKRKGIGFEINPGYRDLIQKRIEEDWNPPSIDSMYITMGSKQVNDLLESTINEVLNFVDRSDQLDTVRRKILKKLSKDKVFSKAFLEKLKQFSNPNDASTNQESSNEDLV